MYTPDKWVVLKIRNEHEVQFKVLAGWKGGYLSGDAWRLNSGITKVERDGDYVIFHGETGSKYQCHLESYGLMMVTSEIYQDFKEAFGDDVDMLPEHTSWIHLV